MSGLTVRASRGWGGPGSGTAQGLGVTDMERACRAASVSPSWAETLPRWYWIIVLHGSLAALSLRGASARWWTPRR